jgi:hypothetical protein
MNDKSAPARDGPRGPTQAGFLSGGGELGELIRSFDWRRRRSGRRRIGRRT